MKKLASIALALITVCATLSAQTAPYTGKWTGTFTPTRADGTPGNAQPVEFNFTQKGKELTGSGGPAGQALEVQKGIVNGNKATWEFHMSNGSVMKFTASITGGKLVADIAATMADGSARSAKIEATKAK